MIILSIVDFLQPEARQEIILDIIFYSCIIYHRRITCYPAPHGDKEIPGEQIWWQKGQYLMLRVRLTITRNDPNFEIRVNDSGTEHHYFHGVNVTQADDGGWVSYAFRPGAIIPDEIARYVAEVTYHVSFGKGLRPHRIRGLYKGHGAEAKLDDVDGVKYSVTLRGPNPEAVMALYLDIREGVAVPVRSFEEPQMDIPSREELLARLENPCRRFLNAWLGRWERFNQKLGYER